MMRGINDVPSIRYPYILYQNPLWSHKSRIIVSTLAATTDPYFRDAKCKKRNILYASCELLKISRRTIHAPFCSLLTFELTHLSIVELKSTALNHSAKLASSEHEFSYAIICRYLILFRDDLLRRVEQHDCIVYLAALCFGSLQACSEDQLPLLCL